MKFDRHNLKRYFLIFSWALYDLANQFFALIVVSVYFVRWLTIEKNTSEIFYSFAFGISTFFVAFFSPLLGAVSDVRQSYKPYLINLTLLSVGFTMLLGVNDNIFLNLLFFAVANFGCQTAIVFYNALMVNVASEKNIGIVSGLGRVFGYSGAILALYFIKPIVSKYGIKAAFLPTGILFLLFSLPCLIFVKDKVKREADRIHFTREKIMQIFKKLKETAFNPEFAGFSDFLKAVFWGLCSVNAVILFMSVYATKAFGLNESQIVNLISFSTFFAILSSMFFGIFSDLFGSRRCMLIVFALWGICFLGGGFVQQTVLFWGIGALVGTALGATWVLSRALAIKLVPRELIGEVFGLFNLVGYLAGIVGALFWGVMVHSLKQFGAMGYRVTLMSLSLFMAIGFVFLLRIPDKK